MMGCVLHLDVKLVGGWMPYDACPFRALVVLYLMLTIFTLFTLYGMKWLVYGMLFPHLSTYLGCFRSRNNGLDNDSPCGAWAVDEPLAYCMMLQL